MKKILSAEDRLDGLLSGLENHVLFASDNAVLEDSDVGDIRTASEIIASRLARHGRGAASSTGRNAPVKRTIRSLIARPPVRPIGLSVAYSSDTEDEVAARRKSDVKATKPD